MQTITELVREMKCYPTSHEESQSDSDGLDCMNDADYKPDSEDDAASWSSVISVQDGTSCKEPSFHDTNLIVPDSDSSCSGVICSKDGPALLELEALNHPGS